MNEHRSGKVQGRAGSARGAPILLLLSAVVLAVAAACSAAPSGEREVPEAPSPSGQQEQEKQSPAEGEPVQYPPGKPKEPPRPPEGITPVPVPTEVEEGEASSRTEGGSRGMGIRAFEVPVSLGTGPSGSALGPGLRPPDLLSAPEKLLSRWDALLRGVPAADPGDPGGPSGS